MYTATSKALNFAIKLAEERDIPAPGPYQWEADIRKLLRRIQSGDGGLVSGRDCSKVIDWLKTIPRKDAVGPGNAQPRRLAARVTPGCFIMAGRIWVVTERVDKAGVYAKLLVECPDRIRDGDGERVPFELAYDRATSLRALAGLTEAHRMDFATARDYVIRYGKCFAPRGRGVCGITLKAADSVEIGIGPICGQFFPGYDDAVKKLRADRKHALYEQARGELGIALSDVELYDIAGPQVSTVAGIERKLDSAPALV
jgi:hypothetical protein